ncbi:MAG: hypothetical protein OEY14_10545, partial [Myxococcales bacterium]|nr:hypothetical protein [Myxococcales bacterium]
AFCAPADEAHLCESTGGRCAGSCACACPHAYHFEEGFGCVLDGPPYECDAFFCPLPEGAACDREASACAPDLVCCSGGRADGLTPTCRRPCDCAVE